MPSKHNENAPSIHGQEAQWYMHMHAQYMFSTLDNTGNHAVHAKPCVYMHMPTNMYDIYIYNCACMHALLCTNINRCQRASPTLHTHAYMFAHMQGPWQPALVTITKSLCDARRKHVRNCSGDDKCKCKQHCWKRAELCEHTKQTLLLGNKIALDKQNYLDSMIPMRSQIRNGAESALLAPPGWPDPRHTPNKIIICVIPERHRAP